LRPGGERGFNGFPGRTYARLVRAVALMVLVFAAAAWWQAPRVPIRSTRIRLPSASAAKTA
jgi:hypothetical protein